MLDVARGLPGAPPLAEMLTRGMPALLKEAAFAAALEGFVTAASALYEAAGEGDERTMREVLALDTVAVRAADGGVALRVIGPLHLLSIGQTLVAHRALDDAKDLPDNARRLVARAMGLAPAAPGTFPDESRRSCRSRAASAACSSTSACRSSCPTPTRRRPLAR